MQLSFGPAAMWAERTDATGSGIGPRQFGVLQDVDITTAFTSKELYGQNQFPAALASGQGKVTGKAKMPQINVLLYADTRRVVRKRPNARSFIVGNCKDLCGS